MSRAPWCVIDGRWLRCRRCGEELQVPLPIRVEIFVALNRAFVKCHRDCEAEAETAAETAAEGGER